MATTPVLGSSFLGTYLEQCKTLAKTLVIKSSISAVLVNQQMELKYGGSAVDPLDPSSWKYYLNIAGEYHPTDKVMTVTSLDTLQQIAFTKANLAVHTSTREAYQYGTRYYYSLLNQYPDQDQLILGILYPVDITQAIAADDASILGYPSELVEQQEQTLIPELQRWIQQYRHRWDVPAFGVTDSLYNAAAHALMYLHIYPKILNLRSKRCHTNEVHSFHIREYLASHKELHRYLPYLTLKQSLWFYRNINYVMRHAGSVETFQTLLQHILTERHIPVSEYSVRHLNDFDEDLYPEIQARRKPINDEFNTAEVSYLPVNQLYVKEIDLAFGNQRYYVASAEQDTQDFKNSPSSVIQSKDLESNMVDYSNAVPDPLPRVLMRQWAFMATHGLYNVAVRFKDPKTGEPRSLLAKDALIYYQYVFWKSVGFDVTEIPEYTNIKARNHPKPSIADLTSVVDLVRFPELTDLANEILNAQPTLVECFSSTAFFDQSYKIYQQAKAHWYLTSGIGDYEKRGYVQGMVLKLYHDETIVFDTPYASMGEWLTAMNLPLYDFTTDQAGELMLEIFTEATGLTIDDTKLLKNIQRFLIEMMMELSSYSIQTIREINESDVILLNWPMVRPGNFKNMGLQHEWLEMNSRINDAPGLGHVLEEVETAATVQGIAETMGHQDVKVPDESVVAMKASFAESFNVPFLSFNLDADYPGKDPQVSDRAAYIGKEYFDSLSDDQKRQLASVPF